MYYSPDFYLTTKHDRIKGYLGLKSRWILILLFDARFWETALILILVIFFQKSADSSSADRNTKINISARNSYLDSNTSLNSAVLSLGYKYNASQIYSTNPTRLLLQNYVNKTFSLLEDGINNTISTNFMQENKTNTAIISKMKIWKKMIMTNLTAQSNNFKQFQKDLSSDSWVPSSNSLQLNKLILNYTWIKDLLDSSSLQSNTYKRYYQNLDSIISELEQVKKAINRNITTSIRSSNQNKSFVRSGNVIFKLHDSQIKYAKADLPTSATNGTVLLSTLANSKKSDHLRFTISFLWLLVPLVLIALQLLFTYKQYINEQNGVRELENNYIPNKLEFIYGLFDSHKTWLSKSLTRWLGFGYSPWLESRISWFLSSFMGVHARLANIIYYIFLATMLHFFFIKSTDTVKYTQSLEARTGSTVLNHTSLINIASNFVPSDSEKRFTQSTYSKITSIHHIMEQANSDIENILEQYNISAIMNDEYSYLNKYILDSATDVSNLISYISFTNSTGNFSETENIAGIVEYKAFNDNHTRYNSTTVTNGLSNALFYYTISLTSIVCLYLGSCVFCLIMHS